MDALELVELARLGSASSGLRDVLQAPIPQLAMEHCREASDRANRSEAHLQDLRGMMVEVAAQRDTALQEVDAAWGERDAAVAFGLRVARVVTEARQERDEARRERDEALEELAKLKRARTS